MWISFTDREGRLDKKIQCEIVPRRGESLIIEKVIYIVDDIMHDFDGAEIRCKIRMKR